MTTLTAPPDGHRDGLTYDPRTDYDRLNRQAALIFQVMADHDWHTLHGIAAHTGQPEASVSARLRDLRKPRFGGWEVQRRRQGSLWCYRLTGYRTIAEPTAPEVVVVADSVIYAPTWCQVCACHIGGPLGDTMAEHDYTFHGLMPGRTHGEPD